MKNATAIEPGKQMKILAIGAPGSGKTTAALSLPGRKFAILFDPNAAEAIAGQDIDYVEFLPDDVPIQAFPLAVKNQPKVPSKKWSPKAYRNFEEWYYENMTEEFISQYDWIIMDSYTSLANIVLDEIMHLNKRHSRRPMIDDYGALVQSMENIFRDLMPKVNNLYVTAHAFLDKDEITGALMWILQMTKGQMKNIPLLFTDLWAFEAGEKGEFLVQTTPDRRHPWVRSSLRGAVNPVETVTIQNWKDPGVYGIERMLKKAGKL